MADYLALARACRSENQFNRLHIDLDRTLAPLEIAAIRKVADTQGFPRAGRAWLKTVEEQSPTLFAAPEPFERQAIHDNLALYRGGSRRDRARLLIAFTGIARRLMIPTASFLQALDARDWDVALVKNAGSFLDGAEGLASDLDGLLRVVSAKVGPNRYASVTVFGVSSGGGPAIVAACRLGARRGVSMCGSSGERLLGTSVRPHLWPLLMRRRPELVYVHGAGNETDREAAGAMAASWGGSTLPVDGVQSHNVMGSLLKRGLLKGFLAGTL